MEERRNILCVGLSDMGFDVLPCHGTYFLTVDFRALGFDGDDMDFCRHITTEAGVAAVPISAFYGNPKQAPHRFVRFCFCKEKKVLADALDRLRRHFG